MILKNIKMASFCGKRIILSQNSLLKIPRRNGYLILVPEIGDDLPGKYPLLKEDKSPEFTNITIEKCVAAIGKQTLEFEDAVRTLEKQIKDVENITWETLLKNVLNPLEELMSSLSITWGIAKTLYVANQSLMPTQCYLSINDRARKASAAKYISVPIYQACKNIMKNEESKLTDEQKRLLEKLILEGKLNGCEFSEKQKAIFSDLKVLLLGNLEDYAKKVKSATNHYTFTIRDEKIAHALPESLLKATVADSTKYLVGPWTITLQPNIMQPFMKYCPDRALRLKVWYSNVIKASVLQDSLVQTSTSLEYIRSRRIQQANMLGYKTFTDLSMETKMAGSVENIYRTMDNLLATARPAQEYEIRELQAFANERGVKEALQHWDIEYWGRKHLSSVHKFNEEEYKAYFPLPKVLSGLFQLIETLFDVRIVESKKPDVWHKDVRFFDFFDLTNSSTEPISSFYLDLYAREDQKMRILQDSGTLVPIQNRSKVSGIKPLSALIFSFQPPVGNRPSLLSFRNLRVLFQEFGHMLQHALTRVEYMDIAGHSAMEWDTIFVSDYLLENWLYEPLFLQEISCHRDNNEPLPSEMIEKLKIVKSHLAGYHLCQEMYLAHFDLELYRSKEFWNTIMGHIWDKYNVIPAHKKDSHVCSFEEIFSGQWAAAYYSFIWSRMIAADLYSAFEDVSYANKEQLKELGTRYRELYLATGGTYSGRELFRKFRGRDPNPKALLKNLGLDIKCNMLEASNQE